jgi:hypothetical protein
MFKHLLTKTLVLAAILACPMLSSAQTIANYSVSRTTGNTYNSISGTGSSIASWRNNTNQYTQDDNRSAAVDIGFDFWYIGVRYTQFSVSTNGFMDLSSNSANGNGSGVYGYENSRFSNTTPTALTLAPMYDDLTAQGGSEALGNSLKYQVDGTAPNRVLTVEWVNIAVYNNTSPSLNFQVKLYETTGIIEFVYGTMTAGSANYSYSCGINNSTISNPPTTVQLLTQQTANTATFSNAAKNNLTTIPATDSKISFTPPNHSGTFNASLSFTSITSSSMNVNYNNWCTNEIGYAIYNSTDNTNFNFVVQQAANTTSYAATGLSPNTQYYWRVYAVTEGKVSTDATGNATTSAAGNKVSTGNGSWGSNGTWSPSGVPTATDNVTIKNGHTVTINTNASCNNLTVGEGTSGILRLGNNGTGRSFTINGNVTVNNGATFIAGTSNATHTATINGNITNNGTFDFRPTSSRVINLTINGISSLSITGNGGTTRFNNLSINMDGNADNILNFSSSNLSLENNSITLNSGTIKFNSTYTLNLDVASGNITLPISTGVYVNNPNVTLNFRGNVVLAGRLNLDAGTINIGDATDEYLESSGGIVDIKGGAMNVAARYFSTNINTLSNFSISDGVFTVPSIGSSNTTFYPFHINATGSTFNVTGGTIVIQQEGGDGTNDYGIYLDGLSTNVISDGTVQFGNNTTPSSQIFKVFSTSEFPNFTIHNANSTVSLQSPITIDNNLTITAGSLLSNGNNINLYGNWSSTGTHTPGANTTSFIGTGTQTITNSNTENFNDLVVDKPSGNLVLAASVDAGNVTLTNGHLQINSNTLSLTNLSAGASKLIGSNTSNLTINGTGDFGTLNLLNTSTTTKTLNNLTINRTSAGSVTIGSDSLRIKNTLDIQNGTLTTSNRLILISDASNTARIASLINGDISGNVIAQRFIPGGVNKRQWRYLASPVNVGGSISIAQFKDNIFVTGPGGAANGFDASPNNSISFRTYLESRPGHVDSGWVTPANASATFATGTGISVFVRGSRNLANPFLNWTVPDNVTIDLIGAVNKGNFTFNLSYTNNGISNADGMNLVANPYPSPIDFLASNGITKTNITNYYTVYNPILRAYGIFDGNLNSGTNNITRYISSGQSFFVKATGPGASIQFTEQVKVGNAPINFFRKAANPNILSLVLEKDSTTSDELIIAFKENSNTDDSDVSDIPKLFNENLNFYSKSSNNTNLAINQYPIPGYADTINLSVFSYNEGSPLLGTYSILFNNVASIQSDINLYLADFYSNKIVNLRNHAGYTFSIDADINSMGNNRFKLIAGALNLNADALTKQNFVIYPNPSNAALNVLFAETMDNKICTIELVDQLGRKVFEKQDKVLGAKWSLDLTELPSGLYIVNIITEQGSWNSKFIKQ